jgi:hypothetical protein
MRHAFACLTALALLGAAGPLDAQLVRGQVVDSVLGSPVAGATVALVDASGAEVTRTVTDGDGLFLLRAPSGEYRLRAEMEGYRTSTFPVFTIAAETPTFMLLLPNLNPTEPPPTLERLATDICGEGVVQPGQGVLMGFVREGSSDRPVAGVTVTLSWGALTQELAGFVSGGDLGRLGAELVTDSTGFYAACGLPVETQITVHAARDELFSDFFQILFGDGGVFLGEEFHARRTAWHHDLAVVPPAQRNAGIAGMVLDGNTMEPLTGVTVSLAETNLETTTSTGGVFRLTELPTGPVQLALRFPGYRPVLREVELQRDETLTFPPGAFRMETAPTELQPVIVEADAARGRRPLEDFYARRNAGSGAFVTREEWETRGQPEVVTDIIRRMQGVRIYPNEDYGFGAPQWIISMSRGSARRGGDYASCPSLLYIDNQYIGNGQTVFVDETISVSDLAAIEAHGSLASIPPEFNRRGAECGVIVFWTR